MTVVGYTRLSKSDERDALGLAGQRRSILDAYPDARVHEEVASGGRANNRPVLQGVLAGLRRGDTLVVKRLDRLTRSLADFARIIEDAKRRGWAIVVLDEGFDMTTPSGRAMAGMLAVFAQYERELIGARTREALAEKMATGWRPHRPVPRKPTAFRRQVLKLYKRGLSQRAIAAELGTHKETVARILRAA